MNDATRPSNDSDGNADADHSSAIHTDISLGTIDCSGIGHGKSVTQTDSANCDSGTGTFHKITYFHLNPLLKPAKLR